MSIWDSVKPKKKTTSVTAVVLSRDQRELALTWSDGVSTKVAARRLRQYCPCAGCVEEWSGKRTFEVETIPEDMKVIEVHSVGNYALSFTFGDLHTTGIYQWEYLKDLSVAPG
ncbi:MAG: DUF971 domain-containing protein [Archangium sp.]|nr:DUF971 domain-containing protein [Archangium sp.]